MDQVDLSNHLDLYHLLRLFLHFTQVVELVLAYQLLILMTYSLNLLLRLHHFLLVLVLLLVLVALLLQLLELGLVDGMDHRYLLPFVFLPHGS
jgi:hypothetical protein